MTDRALLLRELRQHAGHTQAEAAELVHVELRTWERWEGGRHPVAETALHLYALLVGGVYQPPAAADL